MAPFKINSFVYEWACSSHCTYNCYTKHFPIWGISTDTQWHNKFRHALINAMWYISKKVNLKTRVQQRRIQLRTVRTPCWSKFCWKLSTSNLQAFGRFWPWVSDRAPSYALLPVTVFQYALKNSDEACHPPDIREKWGREGGGLFCRKSHHRKWHSRYFLYVTVWERERERFEMR